VNIFETIRFALRGVTANKLRSGLTVLGILIGVAAVILLVAVGNGSQQAIQNSIEQLGTNTLTVTSGGGGVRGGGASTTNTALTMDLLPALDDKNAAPHVKSVSPVITGSQTATYDGTDATISQTIGTYPEYISASNYTLAEGSSFTMDDVNDARNRRPQDERGRRVASARCGPSASKSAADRSHDGKARDARRGDMVRWRPWPC
jgi:putative ABC transport system permease protein